MKTKIVECVNLDFGEPFNHGKFLVGLMDTEWDRKSEIDQPHSMLRSVCGWPSDVIWVMDLQTGEGALFRPTGLAKADLEKHRIWVCLLYEPFLEWLYSRFRETQSTAEVFDTLPTSLTLADAPSGLYGYRRPGPDLHLFTDEEAAAMMKEVCHHECIKRTSALSTEAESRGYSRLCSVPRSR